MDTAAKGLGPCGVCGRTIPEFTKTRSVTLAGNRAYICHQTCHPDYALTTEMIMKPGDIKEIMRSSVKLPDQAELDELIERNRPRLEESLRRGEQELAESGGTPLDDLVEPEPPGVISNPLPDPPDGAPRKRAPKRVADG